MHIQRHDIHALVYLNILALYLTLVNFQDKLKQVHVALFFNLALPLRADLKSYVFNVDWHVYFIGAPQVCAYSITCGTWL